MGFRFIVYSGRPWSPLAKDRISAGPPFGRYFKNGTKFARLKFTVTIVRDSAKRDNPVFPGSTEVPYGGINL